MSIAENIRGLLDRLGESTRAPSLDLPSELASPCDRAAWAATVQQVCTASLPAVGDHERGRAMRARVMRLLRGFASQAPISIPYPRSTWRYLLTLAELCARERHWDCMSGPIVGCSNSVIEQRLGSNPRRILRSLARYGFIIPHSPKGNGHRYIREKADGTLSGAGWSLAPLIALIDALELVDAQEKDIRSLHIELPRRIVELTRSIAVIIAPFVDQHGWAQDVAADLQRLRADREANRKGPPEALNAIVVRAEHILEQCRAVTAQFAGAPLIEKTSSRVDLCVHDKDTDPLSTMSLVTCSPNRSSGKREPGLAVKVHKDDDPDRHGILRSGFRWSDAPALFPWLDVVDRLDGPNSRAWAFQLGRLLHISDAAITAAQRQMGDDCSAIAMLITGQHLSDGAIRSTPETYFRGMIARDRRGDLNIGHSLFGRREKVGIHVRPSAPVPV